MLDIDPFGGEGPGAGSALNPVVLVTAGVATLVATVVSIYGVFLQLKNYRKPILQRMVIRIMLMVPLYAISSLISLFSLDAAFAIDAIRDVYEAFVIYCFFSLLIAYLGGERSLLILLYGRPPKQHVFPVSLFKHELDASDPFTFLFLKRGILQYVQVKPILAVATLILKATGTYKEGSLSWSSGYLYVSIVYNTSICLSLYCLAMFWVCVNQDIKPFRPVPKFLCVKGILFFSFWQALAISALVAAGIIRHIGPYTDPEHMSLAMTDTLICYEMPFFAFAHWFAFSHTDYIDKNLQYAARMPFYYAFRDAFGVLDVLEDSRATLKGGVSYRTFEPVEGGMHQGVGRERRIKAGLRYAKGGRQKYWLPMPQKDTDVIRGPMSGIKHAIEANRQSRHGYAPLYDDQGANVVHIDSTLRDDSPSPPLFAPSTNDLDEGIDPEGEEDLEFEDPDTDEEDSYIEGRKLLFGDYHYPCIDVSGEAARQKMWDEEERILTDQHNAAFLPRLTGDDRFSLLKGTRGVKGQYGATGSSRTQSDPDLRAAKRALDPSRKDKGKGVKPQRSGVYGGWAEANGGEQGTSSAPSTPRHNGVDVPTIHVEEGTSIIDLAPDGSVPNVSADAIFSDGIKLRYSKNGRVHSLRSRSPSPNPNPNLNPPSPSRLKESIRPAGSRRPSAASNTSPPSTPSSPGLPPDAIDLVVEDHEAEQEEMTRERRKGEPAVRQTGARKVYRKEYVVEVDDNRGNKREKKVEVEVEQEPGIEDPNKGDQPEMERTRVKTEGMDGQDVQAAVGELYVADEVEEMSITRAATPPPHVQIEVQTKSRTPPLFSPDLEEENPWA